MHELSAEQLRAQLGGVRPSLISCLSFEDRSLAVAEALVPCGLLRWLCLLNQDIETDVSEIKARATALAERAGVSIEFREASKQDPIVLADTLANLAEELNGASPGRWVADVTTMTHEMLLMVVAAAEEIIPAWEDLAFFYNVAGKYSGDDEASRKWTSRGIRDFRSVIGYPGAWSPGEPTSLVALPGFDPERTSRIVEEIEPEQLLVGIAHPAGSHHEWSLNKNREIAAHLLETRSGQLFEYQALDPFAAVDAVIEATRDLRGNVLIVPLNSKISTVAIGILARQRPEWQVCYAPALVYNLRYATTSDCFLACTLGNMKAHVHQALAASHADNI